jgi:hypothetical protein
MNSEMSNPKNIRGYGKLQPLFRQFLSNETGVINDENIKYVTKTIVNAMSNTNWNDLTSDKMIADYAVVFWGYYYLQHESLYGNLHLLIDFIGETGYAFTQACHRLINTAPAKYRQDLIVTLLVKLLEAGAFASSLVYTLLPLLHYSTDLDPIIKSFSRIEIFKDHYGLELRSFREIKELIENCKSISRKKYKNNDPVIVGK